MATNKRVDRAFKSEAFKRLKEILGILLIDYDDQVITLIKHLIADHSGNAEQLSTSLLKQIEKELEE